MSIALARTKIFKVNPKARDYVVAIYYHGVWKETRLFVTLDEARETARDIHRRTGLVVQVRQPDETIIAQHGYPISESICDDATWIDED